MSTPPSLGSDAIDYLLTLLPDSGTLLSTNDLGFQVILRSLSSSSELHPHLSGHESNRSRTAAVRHSPRALQ